MDLGTIAAGTAAAKAGFETLRTAVGLVKDALGLLPAGEKKDAFPPTPMLAVGYCIGPALQDARKWFTSARAAGKTTGRLIATAAGNGLGIAQLRSWPPKAPAREPLRQLRARQHC